MALQTRVLLQRPDFKLNIDCLIAGQGFTGIYGHSGSGKTSLLRVLAGLEKGDPGTRIRFAREIWQDDSTFLATEDRQIGLVFQDSRLFPHMSVKDNLDYAYKRRFRENGFDFELVDKWLDVKPLYERQPEQLSGGEKQRVALARVLLSSPRLIMMDEPMASLDNAAREEILQRLEGLQQYLPVPVIYISHNIAELSRVTDDLLVMKHGKVVSSGPMLELSTSLESALTHEENAAAILHARVAEHDDEYQLSKLSVAHMQHLYVNRLPLPEGSVTRVRVPARDVSIQLEKPENTSILNLLNCGVDAIEARANGKYLVKLKLGQQFLLAMLSKKSIDHLAMKKNQRVWAQVKSTGLLTERTPG